MFGKHTDERPISNNSSTRVVTFIMGYHRGMLRFVPEVYDERAKTSCVEDEKNTVEIGHIFPYDQYSSPKLIFGRVYKVKKDKVSDYRQYADYEPHQGYMLELPFLSNLEKKAMQSYRELFDYFAGFMGSQDFSLAELPQKHRTK
jgi:hypothetical protein